ncbi:apolipoprotein N-acyltransferase [Mesonia sp.]|uniref:apolipoprotein N-acyltransferase n=1 Tax=Mesonia sp. TaxID=1960830 RepID=UPI00175C6638|nr:apolipoprotein N-acyltransferase [Mesonia sp.]HIB37484.1 apolipoprotein N-acyltransferase [Mesonia sp.]HIO27815.1 apolipoprotein N-acyltransferase [Flavobacteriaceae bacterium]
MKNFLLALSSGILLALAWPTYGFPLLLFFAFVPFLLAEFNLRQKDQKVGIKVFLFSYLTFFIWNIITTNWLYFSTPFGMWFAVLANSLLMTLVFFIYHKIAKKVNFTAGATFLVSLWMCFEKMHLNWEFSWPWLNLGNGFSEYISWIQWYEYTGTFGGTLWVWLLNLVIFKSVILYLQHRDRTIIFRGIFKSILLIIIPLSISIFLFYTEEEVSEEMEVVILQPNINPYTEKYYTSDRNIGELLVKLSNEKITDSTKLVLAPETVFADGTKIDQFKYSNAFFYGKEMSIQHPQTNFLGGISFIKVINDEKETTPQSNFYKEGLWFNDYNSAFLINQTNPEQIYHKSKLVVGVENFPYQSTLKPILGDAMIDLGGTVAMKTTQRDREVFALNSGEKVAPIICYESVYGDYITKYVKNGAQLLAIITNDAWWGNTQGHQQHLSYARLRAIENRKNVVRSANTGISAVINSKGEILNSLGYEEQGSLKVKVNLNNELTFYTQYGDYLPRIAQFLALFIFLFALTRRRNQV